MPTNKYQLAELNTHYPLINISVEDDSYYIGEGISREDILSHCQMSEKELD
jgi:hypothetical protein